MKLLRFTLAILLLFAVRLEAHEIGTTRVSASFPEGKAYEIEIITDAAALVEKLEIVSGISSPPDSARKAAELETLLPGYEETFRRRVLVAFDGNAVRPTIRYSVSGEPTATTSPVAVIKLIGEVPQGAREFEWTWSWTFATYSLTAGESTEWLEGGQPSAPVLLTTVRQTRSRASTGVQYLALGFTHIVPHGLDHMLFVLGIFFLTRRFREILSQVTAFTIAHSITLALSVYGLVSIPPQIVEPLIAVSIAYVAIENIFMSELKDDCVRCSLLDDRAIVVRSRIKIV